MTYAIRLPDGFEINDDQTRLDLGMIHRFLSEESYWARGRSRTVVARSIAHSLPLGAYAPGGEQVGFAMAVTDRTVFALLSNVFVLPEWRGRKLGEALVRAILAHPDLTSVTRWVLNTNDAHGLYARFGFQPPAANDTAMELRRG